MATVVKGCQSPLCPSLRAEQAKLARLKPDGQAAAAAYQPPGERQAPDGYHNATPAELKQMKLSEAMLEHPKDGKGNPTEFRAAVFVNDANPAQRIVAFKGTTPNSTADWLANGSQQIGRDSFYYKQAQVIGNNVAASPLADTTRVAGHSLGGGLAAAAARSGGLDASTFNAAALKEGTVPQPRTEGEILAMSVRGDPLTRANEGMLGTTANTVPYKLDPPARLGESVAKKLPWYDLKGKAQAFAARQLALHDIATANEVIAARAKVVDAQVKANGC